MPYANNKGADQNGHPCSLISTIVVHCFLVLYIFILYAKFGDSSWFESCLDVKPKGSFSQGVTHMYYEVIKKFSFFLKMGVTSFCHELA